MKRLNGVCIEYRHTDCTHSSIIAQITLTSVKHRPLRAIASEHSENLIDRLKFFVLPKTVCESLKGNLQTFCAFFGFLYIFIAGTF
jgi:hypothetical protein